MSIVLRELDKEKFNKNVTAILDIDELHDDCETNFKDIIIDTIVQMISEIVEKDGWDLQYFKKDESEKLFKAFMENSKITVQLNKKINELDYDFKEVIIEFSFSRDEKKKIAEIYLDSILNQYRYLDGCIFYGLEEKSIYIITELLSNEVYKLLSPGEIKAIFREKIEKIISGN